MHLFKVKQLVETNELSPKLYFLFDKELQFKKARIEQINIGHYDFEVLIPFQERQFTEKDWGIK